MLLMELVLIVKDLGVKYKIDIDLVIPDKTKSILDGAIKPINLDEESSIMYTELTNSS